MTERAGKIVREFRHILLWPLQLRRLRRETGFANHWEVLRAQPGPWREVKDNLLADDDSCQTGYQEFVYFLPYVQRFLYGFGEADAQTPSSLHMFQRDDIATARLRLAATDAPIDLAVARTRLVFFYDQDVALLALEVVARDLPLEHAIDVMDRFGRPYPPYWEGPGQGAHCTFQVEFLDAAGGLLSASDYGDRDKYVGLVRDIKQTPLSLHWEYLLHPMVPAYLGGGVLQYYQIENKRIPIMTYLAMDEPRALTRGDLARIGYAAKWGPSDTLPFAPRFLADFEEKHCYDRFWDGDNAASGMNTRFVFCGVAFAMVTRHDDERTDLVHTFRQQFFQIGLIANFHKAALLNLSNRFSIAVERLRVGDYASVRIFKDSVREALELFLRFNHRYWFHEISNQVLRGRHLLALGPPAGQRRALRRGARGRARHQPLPRRRPHAQGGRQRDAPHGGVGARDGGNGGDGFPRHEPLQPHRALRNGEVLDLRRRLRAHDPARPLHGGDLQAHRHLLRGAVLRAPDLAGEVRRLPPDLEAAAEGPQGEEARGRRRRAVAAQRGAGCAPCAIRAERLTVACRPAARRARSWRSGSANRALPGTASRARRGSARTRPSTPRSGAASWRCTPARRWASATAGATSPIRSSRSRSCSTSSRGTSTADDPRAFSQDAMALECAQLMVQRGWDAARLPVERQFAYLPFEHSESLDMQDRSVALFSALEAFPETKGLAEWAQKHRVIVRRFGRFPHRNAALGRESTQEEIAFLREPGSRF